MPQQIGGSEKKKKSDLPSRSCANVPILSKAMMMERRRNLGDVADDGDGIRTSQILNLQQIWRNHLC
ncbi:hypothetical protein M0R45_027328 [Rubus argutus]|uniref:Uncharacterized protein n=1 Tax=Rubus argutus TaxID=59490 RepID=A0AAW1X1U1_RUBAR